MNVALITDYIQVSVLLMFCLAIILVTAIVRYRPPLRPWIVPPLTWVISGTLFYVVVVAEAGTPELRTLWSVLLRLHAVSLLVIGLAAVYWLTQGVTTSGGQS